MAPRAAVFVQLLVAAERTMGAPAKFGLGAP
jgi:hypothetical protein